MHLILDALLIVVCVCGMVRGWRRGFAGTILKNGRWILSLMITLTFGSAFSAWIDRNWIHPPVYERIRLRFVGIADAAGGRLDALISGVPSIFRPYIDMSAVEYAEDMNRLTDEWSQSVANGISGTISTVIGHLFLFLIAYVALTLAVALLKQLTNLPVVGMVDRVLGLTLGITGGILTVVFLSVILGAVLRLSGYEEILERTFLLRAVYSLVGFSE